jgi:bacteriocin biosynthesis cyclodehydratase domain-containing protein
VEVFPAADGDVYLLRTGGAPLVAIRSPTGSDRELLGRLVRGIDSVPGSPTAERIEPLVAAGLVRAAPPAGSLPPVLAQRFSRQLPYLAELGDPAVLLGRLRRTRVTVLGCGGLGTWTLAAVASAGVGRFRLVDDDAVELSNLNRQILYGADDVGSLKVVAACRWLRRFDPAIEVEALPRRVTSVREAEAIVRGAELVILAADWPPYELARWVNAACVAAGVPFLTAGQQPPLLKVGPAYVPGHGPCFDCHERALERDFPLYRDLAEHRRRHGTTDTTLGPAAALVGTALAVEVLNLLLGVPGRSLAGRALLIDMETLEQRSEDFERDRDCPTCGHLPWH